MMNLWIFDPKKLEPHNVQSWSYLSDTVAAVLWSNKELKHTVAAASYNQYLNFLSTIPTTHN
jgi:hypothetical protein